MISYLTTSASGGSSINEAVDNAADTQVIIRNSSIDGLVNVVGGGSGATRFVQSSLLSGHTGSGTLSCINSDNGIATALNASCD